MAGFLKKDELLLWQQRRTTRKALGTTSVDGTIVERYYQTRAIRRIGEVFETDRQRKALLVMATGSGKTRTVIALIDQLMRANWASCLNGVANITAEIVSAHVSNNSVAVSDLPNLISGVYAAINRLSNVVVATAAPAKPEPAVAVRSSIKPDHLVCLEDGKRLKTLKRHLRTSHGMTPDQYRARWNLASDYPMVAPNYAAARSEMAKKFGLGNSRGAVKPVRRSKIGLAKK